MVRPRPLPKNGHPSFPKLTKGIQQVSKRRMSDQPKSPNPASSAKSTANKMLISSIVLMLAAFALCYLAIIAGTAAGHGTSKDAAPFFYVGALAAIGSVSAALASLIISVRAVAVYPHFHRAIIPATLELILWIIFATSAISYQHS